VLTHEEVQQVAAGAAAALRSNAGRPSRIIGMVIDPDTLA
jgi:hypothetical protein